MSILIYVEYKFLDTGASEVKQFNFNRTPTSTSKSVNSKPTAHTTATHTFTKQAGSRQPQRQK